MTVNVCIFIKNTGSERVKDEWTFNDVGIINLSSNFSNKILSFSYLISYSRKKTLCKVIVHHINLSIIILKHDY